MELHPHDMPALFSQLGLPNEPQDIDAFIKANDPLPPETPLPDAPFWSSAQSRALKEMLRDDSDWAVVVDVLSNRLREG